jgi:hypothetical protein
MIGASPLAKWERAMMEHLPVALRQLAERPGFALMFAALVAAFLLLLRFLRTRPRCWRYSQMALHQGFVIAMLLAIMFGMV